jgi:alginate O-acetyltransferase complex protein AlgJ
VSEGILRGKDDWLFLVGGSNVVATLYDRQSALTSDAKLRKWADLIEERASRLERLGTQYVHMHVPEKLTIYDNMLHDPPAVDWKLSPAIRLGEIFRDFEHSNVWLDLVLPFRSRREERNLFFKTDSHWSLDGCFLAHTLVCAALGVGVAPSILERSTHEVFGVGDLGLKLDPPVPENRTAYEYRRYAKRVYANSIARYLESAPHPLMHVGSHVRYRNDASWAAKKRILIFGDSSSNINQMVLTGMLAESVRDVEFIWSSSLDWSYIERSRPDAIVYELVERFMTILPDDQLKVPTLFTRQAIRAEWLRFKEKKL